MKPLAGLFLALACILGIAATGSVFELAYGDPDLGVTTTRTILGLALPGTVLSLLLATRALLFPGRVVPYREGDGGWWNDLRDDWRLWWQRRQQGR